MKNKEPTQRHNSLQSSTPSGTFNYMTKGRGHSKAYDGCIANYIRLARIQYMFKWYLSAGSTNIPHTPEPCVQTSQWKGEEKMLCHILHYKYKTNAWQQLHCDLVNKCAYKVVQGAFLCIANTCTG